MLLLLSQLQKQVHNKHNKQHRLSPYLSARFPGETTIVGGQLELDAGGAPRHFPPTRPPTNGIYLQQ
jgi:hypothetical protein